jgi:hypothetical protein
MLERMVRSLHGGTGSHERNLEGLRRRERVGVERDCAPTRVRQRIDVLRRVHTEELSASRGARRRDPGISVPPSRDHGVEHERALGTLGMARRWGVFFEPGRGQQQHRN